MNTEFVSKWIEALRSGEYEQCTDGGYSVPSYPNENEEVISFCCLGLGAHLLGVRPSDYHSLVDQVPELDSIIIESEARPDSPFSSKNQKILSAHLTAMNDGAGIYSGNQHSFSEIADVLEKYLRKGAEL